MTQPAGSDQSFEQRVCALMRARDQRCIDMLYDKYGDALYGVAMQVVRDESAANDVVQDSFIKIWKNCHTFDSARSRIFTWMYRIVRNTAIDKVRSVKNRSSNEIQTDNLNVSPTTDQVVSPDAIDLPTHLDSLDEKYREVIHMLFFLGHTQQETSEKLNIPLGTVKTRLRIAIRELRKIYKTDSIS